MAHGGKRKGSGRKKKAAASHSLGDGLDPIDFLIGTMRGLTYYKGKWAEDESIELTTKMDAAKSAAPYLYPKLANVDSTLDIEGGLIIQITNYSDADPNTK